MGVCVTLTARAHREHHGGHQEEGAEHEGGEGQPL